MAGVFSISLLAGLMGAIYGAIVKEMATGRGYELLPVYAGLAAFITTGFFWWLITIRLAKPSLWLGALAGGLSGGVAHYLCWYAQIVAANACYLTSGGCLSSLGEPPIDLLNGIWGALVLTIGSLLLFGWVTIPTGLVFGALFGYWQKRSEPAV